MADNAGYEMTLTVGGNTVGYAMDVTISGDATDLDDTSRNDNGWRSHRQGLKGFSIDLTELYVPTDAAHQALIAAWLNNTDVAVTLRDPDAWGWDFTARVLTYTQEEPFDGIVTAPFSLVSRGTVTEVTGTS